MHPDPLGSTYAKLFNGVEPVNDGSPPVITSDRSGTILRNGLEQHQCLHGLSLSGRSQLLYRRRRTSFCPHARRRATWNSLDELLADDTAGDPLTGPKWTRKTIRKLAAQLQPKFSVGRTALRRLLRSKRYALRVNRKRLSRQHDPQRDQQFRYLARQRRKFQKAGFPVLLSLIHI